MAGARRADGVVCSVSGSTSYSGETPDVVLTPLIRRHRGELWCGVFRHCLALATRHGRP
jgi:hypothetical protein